MAIEQKVSDWFLGLLVTLFFLFINITGIFDFTNPLEMKTFDFRANLAAPDERNPDIELVVIEDDDIAELGRFPWPRDILARGIENLSLAGAKVIALNILFTEPEESAGYEALQRLKYHYENLGLRSREEGDEFYDLLNNSLKELDKDSEFQRAIEKAGNVVLPVYFDTESSGSDDRVPDFIARHSIKKSVGEELRYALSSITWFSKLRPVLPDFARVSAGIGHANLFPDPDGCIRRQVHVLGYLKNTYIPSLPLAVVKLYKGIDDDDISVYLGERLELRTGPSSNIIVPTAANGMATLINWNQGPDRAFNQTPFSKVYRNRIKTSLFRDKIVLIGTTAPGIGDKFVTPISGNLPSLEILANSISNILEQRFLERPAWSKATELIVLVLFGLFLTLVLPRLKAGTGAATTLVLLLGYAGFGFGLFFSSNIWLTIVPPTAMLVIGYTLVISKRFLITERTKEKVEADSVETNKMLGLSFQQQGMLDLALDKFQKLPVEEKGVKELIYNLGLDYEKKRQFSKALAAYYLIVEDGKNFRDLNERIPKLKKAEATIIFGGAGKHPGDIGATLLETETRPILGRYEIIAELGRGAMGVVYKGEDPKIHRTVAIKTIDISQFDEQNIGDMKRRFFREAESAGLLAHPNIVTIYDCGEEQDLAYIAMEFMEGVNLESFTMPENLLPIRVTLDIIARVADALDYAHSKNIVHRDIKPANIMQLSGSKEIKVTDFGIARITSSSETKTGIVLGTPSYMSPEQVSGKKVDGRSDIFSLGVLLFEMLTGKKPFTGEDITSLMYKIAREKHPSVRSINPKVPGVVERVVDKALEKDLEKRYQSAGKMAKNLRQIINKIDEISSRKKTEGNN